MRKDTQNTISKLFTKKYESKNVSCAHRKNNIENDLLVVKMRELDQQISDSQQKHYANITMVLKDQKQILSSTGYSEEGISPENKELSQNIIDSRLHYMKKMCEGRNMLIQAKRREIMRIPDARLHNELIGRFRMQVQNRKFRLAERQRIQPSYLQVSNDVNNGKRMNNHHGNVSFDTSAYGATKMSSGLDNLVNSEVKSTEMMGSMTKLPSITIDNPKSVKGSKTIKKKVISDTGIQKQLDKLYSSNKNNTDRSLKYANMDKCTVALPKMFLKPLVGSKI